MTSIFMVHSVLATGKMRYVGYGRAEEDSGYANEKKDLSFSRILQKELEERRTDSLNCRTVTYGMDRRLHSFDYRAREYHY